jgi:hypothetical protein
MADSRLAHEHVTELLIELRGIDLQKEEFEAKFQGLRHTMEQHVAEEDEDISCGCTDSGRPIGSPEG